MGLPFSLCKSVIVVGLWFAGLQTVRTGLSPTLLPALGTLSSYQFTDKEVKTQRGQLFPKDRVTYKKEKHPGFPSTQQCPPGLPKRGGNRRQAGSNVPNGWGRHSTLAFLHVCWSDYDLWPMMKSFIFKMVNEREPRQRKWVLTSQTRLNTMLRILYSQLSPGQHKWLKQAGFLQQKTSGLHQARGNSAADETLQSYWSHQTGRPSWNDCSNNGASLCIASHTFQGQPSLAHDHCHAYLR
ncbi:uncharacterized protein Rac1l isoform X2 [Rattus norvegicus]|uniref:uncharacterized protein Rac1l isoform X2 n=1 Tax=Rattus norvegicus TaxID=10116 RepID=UPI001916FB20|nr:uncharacterized protein LOC120096621 isoform X2 [Rattus norvegicus]